MKLWNWFLTRIGKRFPLPPRHILTYEEIKKYWESLGRWQYGCCIIVLRIRKQPRETAPNIWKPPLFPSLRAMRDAFDKNVPETAEESEPFTIRIDREWEPVPGMKKKEEVCIANFEL